MKRVRRWLFLQLLAVAIAIPIAAVLAAENAVHIWDRPAPEEALPQAMARNSASTFETIRVAASDGVPLEAWVFTPASANGSAVIVLHGVGDTRRGGFGHVLFLTQRGYTVVAPDARGHGVSGGDMITYGLREAGDVRVWADWIFQHRPVERLYGFGASMGGAILLQSLAIEPRFRAVIAEAPFCDFKQIAFDRMSQTTGLPVATFWPIVNLGFLYARLRYGIDLNHASPVVAVRQTRVPILLIHGLLDTNVPIRHSRDLAAANRVAVRLWEVPGAGHLNVGSVAADAYEKTVAEWFHPHP